jgi:phage terminase small subunit
MAVRRVATAARPVWAENLDDREYKFVCEYLVDLNGTQAAVRAGISTEASARQRAYEIVHRAHVAQAIDVAMGEQAAGPRQWLVRKLAAIADGNMGDFGLEWDDKGKVTMKASKDIPREVMALVKKFYRTSDGEVRFELHDPLRAIEMLGKVGAIALTREKLEIEGGLALDMIIRESYGQNGDEKK